MTAFPKDETCEHGALWDLCSPCTDAAIAAFLFTPCSKASRHRGVAVVCTLRADHTGPCCWWAARTSDARSDRGAGAPKDAG